MKEKKYISDIPELMKEWDYEANADLDPAKLTVGSNKKVWWVCQKCGGKWQTHICSRTGKESKHHTGCPYCAGKKVLTGYNDLATKYPDIAKQWHTTKNPLKATEVIPGTPKKFWWKCPNGHDYEARISDRTQKHSACPYCAGKKVLSGFNDLVTVNPELAKEWNYEKNGNLKPADVTAGSHKRAWWKCLKCGYEWQVVIESRGLGHRGCPVCSNKFCVPGKNDLATTHPELAKEWNYEKNGSLKPTDVTSGSDKKVWWKCLKCKGEWQCHVYARTGKDKTGCPYCAGHKVFLGINDLATVNPRLAAEWHPTKNGNLKPKDVYANSRMKVWWTCPTGHEYQMTVNQRNYQYSNCPTCYVRKTTSFPEQAIFYYVKKLWPNSVNKYKNSSMGRMEFDIYIPENGIAIEYDGIAWHKTDDAYRREVQKYKFCKKHKIHLVRIKEDAEPSWNDTADKIYYVPKIKNRNYHTLERVIRKLLDLIQDVKQPLEIDIEKDKTEILNYLSKIDNSLATIRPDVAVKWNYKKNGNLTPDMFSVGSEEVCWWECPDCGNEWKCSIKAMTRQTYGCPKCAKIKRGETRRKLSVQQKGSLAEKMPELAREWHKTKNGDLTPNDVTIGSGKKVWWECQKCGHEWQSVVAGRVSRHYGCTKCARKKNKKQLSFDFK